MFNDFFILLCRQTLSLRLSDSFGKRYYHPQPQNGDNLRKKFDRLLHL